MKKKGARWLAVKQGQGPCHLVRCFNHSDISTSVALFHPGGQSSSGSLGWGEEANGPGGEWSREQGKVVERHHYSEATGPTASEILKNLLQVLE